MNISDEEIQQLKQKMNLSDEQVQTILEIINESYLPVEVARKFLEILPHSPQGAEVNNLIWLIQEREKNLSKRKPVAVDEVEIIKNKHSAKLHTRRLLFISFLLALIPTTLAITLPLWWPTLVAEYPQIKNFLKDNQEIQTLADMLQVMLWIATPLTMLIAFWIGKSKDPNREVKSVRDFRGSFYDDGVTINDGDLIGRDKLIGGITGNQVSINVGTLNLTSSSLSNEIKNNNRYIRFARIEMATKECLWHSTERRPKSCTLGWHQTSSFGDEADERIVDPIFDITLINLKKDPALITGIGFKAIDQWVNIKALYVAGKVKVVDGYEIVVKDFIPGKTTLLKLEDPVYIASNAPYRFKLRLRNYRKAIDGNESCINLVVKVDDRLFYSEGIYLGLF